MSNNSQSFNVGPAIEAVHKRIAAWETAGLGRRIWEKDGTVWVPDPVQAAKTPDLTDRLDWLELPKSMQPQVETLTQLATEIRAEGFTHILLLGMGGSSLAPEVFMQVFHNEPGFPALAVVDSTDPEAVAAAEKSVNLASTLFLVSSKSGGTLETLSFYRYFYDRVAALKTGDPGRQFVAITDPGSKLEALARDKKFRRIIASPPGVGGRFSALTVFGLAPAALIGMDVSRLLESASRMAEASGPAVPVLENPALFLGAVMGELARAGRDKLTFISSPAVAHFNVWIEQLIAESTGKQQKGILPVADEPVTDPAAYGADRLFVYVRLASDANETLDNRVRQLEATGHPVVLIELDEIYDLGGEFFRWEFATAVAGAVLGINPFDQPNVEEAKVKARELMAAYEKSGALPAGQPVGQEGGLVLYGGPAPTAGSLADGLGAFLEQHKAGDYLAVMAYVPLDEPTDAALRVIRNAWRRRTRGASTAGYGPRFLHSTGQLHKGGTNNGLFLQITHTPSQDLAIPGQPYSFGVLVAAQAQGDYQALAEAKRRLMRVHIEGDLREGLRRLGQAVEAWAGR